MADSGAEDRLRLAAASAYAEAEAARLARLRTLILAEDREAQTRLAARLEALEGAALEPEAIRSLLAENLVDALREARDKRGKALSSTLAPVVGGAIRAEIRNSRQEMAETLRPLAGSLVKTAVADSFAKLIEDVNARLDALTSAQGWGLRLKSLATGRSFSELALAELSARGVSRILLIDRRSGGLIAQWPEISPNAEDGDLESGRGGEMIGGMIAAILAFSEEALRSGEGESGLRSLDLGGRSVRLHPRALRILAIEAEGPPSAEIRERMDEAAVQFLNRLSEAAPEEEASLTPLAHALLAAQKAEAGPKRRRGRLLIGGTLLLALAGLLGWKAWEAWDRRAALERVQAALGAEARLEAAPVEALWVGKSHIEVRGVLPQDLDAQALEARLAAAAGEAHPLRPRFAFGASEEETQSRLRLTQLSAEIEDLRRARAQAEAAQAEAARALEESRQAQLEGVQALEAARARIAEQDSRLAELTAGQVRLSAEARRFAALAAEAESPEARLRSWAARTAVFLPEGADLFFAENLEALDEAAEILALPGAPRLRVVGYADRTGGAGLNERLARERAQAVAAELIRRGAPEDRLIVAARLDQTEIVESHGPGSRNRRVQFEAAFPGE